ncbi:hypothetical protein BS78_10G133700 [Paspalum vaginatum]|nr:hypothetical protein BS78_10G133700 [Paspalum vaginatum]
MESAPDISIIHRGQDDFALAELQIDVTRATALPEVRVLNHSVSDRWLLKNPRVVPVHPRDGMDMDHILWYWDTDAVVPIGCWLCWVDYTASAICSVMCLMTALRLFLELPVKQPCFVNRDEVGRGWLEAHHVLGATKAKGGGDFLKFVRVLPDDVPPSDGIIIPVNHPFTNRFVVTTWSLRLFSGDSVVWKEESTITADALMDLEAFDHLPRQVLNYPVIGLNNPDIVSFVLRKENGTTYDSGEIWLVAIDVKKRIVKSSMFYTKDYDDRSDEKAELFQRKIQYFEPFLPVEFSR